MRNKAAVVTARAVRGESYASALAHWGGILMYNDLCAPRRTLSLRFVRRSS